jgi:putative transposase
MLAELEDWPQLGLRVPSRGTINKIMKARGLVRPAPKKRPKSSYRRFAYARPRDCYQIDATEIVLSGGAKVVVFEVLDDHSRVLVATLAWDAETATGAVAAIQRAFEAFGVPALVLSDNGTAFTSRRTKGGTSRFTRNVHAAGARLIHSSPYHPQTCGKVERHHRTFKEWLARQLPPATLEELQGLCDRYQQWYNNHRRHSAHDEPPARTWQHAPQLGGPAKLSLQHDASVHHVKTSDCGNILIGPIVIGLGRAHSWTRVTVIRDHEHITVYDLGGQPIGHTVLDYSRPTSRCGRQPDQTRATVSHNYVDMRVPQLHRQHKVTTPLILTRCSARRP